MNNKIKEAYEIRASILKALAHPTRLYIVDILSSGEKNVGDLTELIKSDMSTVSKHLLILKNASIIEHTKRGVQVFYRLKMPCVLNFFGCIEKVLVERKSELIKLNR
ncbi:MAG: metalloregulator ArsR/SmtB family transcription factor [Candidatus Zixiibacteriota bacterium]